MKGQLIVRNEMGLHARPCAQIVRLVNKFDNIDVSFSLDTEHADGHSVMELMILAAGHGSILDVTLNGDTDKCKMLFKELQSLFSSKFMET